MDFSKIKAERAAKTAKLIESLDKKPTYQNQSDDTRFWKPTMDKEKGVGGAVIRFIPAKGESALDYAMYYQYSFKWAESNQWYIEKSLYTFGKSDPVYELRSRLYATKSDTDKKIAELMRLNKHYIANIKVINDPAHPENNGKNFLYRYPVTIANMMEASLKPVADPLTGKCAERMDAFDVVDGCNLEIRISDSKNGWNYDKTTWATPSPAEETVDAIEALQDKAYALDEFLAPDSFKSYDALMNRLVKVMGTPYIGTGVFVGAATGVAESVQAPAQAEAKQYTPPPAQKSTAPSQDFDNDMPPFDADTKSAPAGKTADNSDDMFDQLMAGM